MRTPIKGKPDFTYIKTEDLITYMNAVQQMIFAYKYESAVITESMQTVWKDINSELCDRQAEENDKFFEAQEKVKKPVFHKVNRVKLK